MTLVRGVIAASIRVGIEIVGPPIRLHRHRRRADLLTASQVAI